MHTAVTGLAGRAYVLAATGHHPYALLHTGGDTAVRGFSADRATAWLTATGPRPAVCALGAPEQTVKLVAALWQRGELPPDTRRLHLPRVGGALLAAHLPVSEPDHWDFRWATSPPAPQPGQERVRRLGPGDHPAIDALLDRAFPATFARPGDPTIRRWYGIRDGSRVVACGADRSRGGVGSLAGIAVDPDAQGHGLGTALTAAMARAVCTEYEVVTLGVMADNDRAARLYRRLGFTHATGRTSVDLVR